MAGAAREQAGTEIPALDGWFQARPDAARLPPNFDSGHETPPCPPARNLQHEHARQAPGSRGWRTAWERRAGEGVGRLLLRCSRTTTSNAASEAPHPPRGGGGEAVQFQTCAGGEQPRERRLGKGRLVSLHCGPPTTITSMSDSMRRRSVTFPLSGGWSHKGPETDFVVISSPRARGTPRGWSAKRTYVSLS